MGKCILPQFWHISKGKKNCVLLCSKIFSASWQDFLPLGIERTLTLIPGMVDASCLLRRYLMFIIATVFLNRDDLINYFLLLFAVWLMLLLCTTLNLNY